MNLTKQELLQSRKFRINLKWYQSNRCLYDLDIDVTQIVLSLTGLQMFKKTELCYDIINFLCDRKGLFEHLV